MSEHDDHNEAPEATSQATLSRPTPAGPPNALRELGRYLYNSNPFYALSATLILVGLHLLCNDESVLADPHSIAAAGWLHLSEIDRCIRHMSDRTFYTDFELDTALELMRTLVAKLTDAHVRLVFNIESP